MANYAAPIWFSEQNDINWWHTKLPVLESHNNVSGKTVEVVMNRLYNGSLFYLYIGSYLKIIDISKLNVVFPRVFLNLPYEGEVKDRL